MAKFNWKQFIGSVAPTLATALGGPMAGMATSAIAEALGVGNSEAEISKTLATANPEILVKLKEIDKEFDVKMKELDIDLEEIRYKDRDSARKLFSVDKRPQIILSVLFILGYFVVFGVLLAGGIIIPDNLKEVIFVLVGLLSREIPTIMQFWFGSSTGSKDKTILMKGK